MRKPGGPSKDQEQGKKQKEISQGKQEQDPRQENNAQKSENDGSLDGEVPPVIIGDLKERQGRGRWGRLPRTVVEQMYDNGRRKLPHKYRLHLEEYFRRLPEFKDK